jgi:hypothetical protein
MEVFGYRRAGLRRRLTRGMRLLLPADPGPAEMLGAVRGFDPAAKRILPQRIQVDGRSQFYLSRPYPIDAGLRREAGLPDDITVAYFVKWVADSDADVARYRAQSAQLLAGLAARFGGTCWPPPAAGAEPPPAGAEPPPAAAEPVPVGAADADPGGAADVVPGAAPVPAAGRGPGGRKSSRGTALLRIGLLFVCAVAFFGFAADDGTAAKWPLLAINALMGLFFAAATVLLAGRALSGAAAGDHDGGG